MPAVPHIAGGPNLPGNNAEDHGVYQSNNDLVQIMSTLLHKQQVLEQRLNSITNPLPAAGRAWYTQSQPILEDPRVMANVIAYYGGIPAPPTNLRNNFHGGPFGPSGDVPTPSHFHQGVPAAPQLGEDATPIQSPYGQTIQPPMHLQVPRAQPAPGSTPAHHHIPLDRPIDNAPGPSRPREPETTMQLADDPGTTTMVSTTSQPRRRNREAGPDIHGEKEQQRAACQGCYNRKGKEKCKRRADDNICNVLRNLWHFMPVSVAYLRGLDIGYEQIQVGGATHDAILEAMAADLRNIQSEFGPMDAAVTSENDQQSVNPSAFAAAMVQIGGRVDEMMENTEDDQTLRTNLPGPHNEPSTDDQQDLTRTASWPDNGWIRQLSLQAAPSPDFFMQRVAAQDLSQSDREETSSDEETTLNDDAAIGGLTQADMLAYFNHLYPSKTRSI